MCNFHNELTKDNLLSLVRLAISNTNEFYYKFDEFGGKLYERNFCYEFYHQLRMLLSSYTSYILSGEPCKAIECDLYYLANKQGEVEKDKSNKRFPDLVLHGGLTNHDENKQLMVIEAKSDFNDKEKVSFDIKKLLVMIHPSLLKFKIGLFIAIGSTIEELNKNLKDIFFINNHLEEDLLRSFCNDISTEFPYTGVSFHDDFNELKKNIYFITTHAIKDKNKIVSPHYFTLEDFFISK